jgi:hypothetical protein
MGQLTEVDDIIPCALPTRQNTVGENQCLTHFQLLRLLL